MKPFYLGMLSVLALGTFFHIQGLNERIANLENSPKTTIKSQIATVKTKPRIKKDSLYAKKGDNLAYWEIPDSRCPANLPYYAGHWGCVVKPVDPNP